MCDAALAKLPGAEERLQKVEEEAPDNLLDAYANEKMGGMSPEEAAGKANASPTAYRVFKKRLEEADAEVRQLNGIIDSLSARNQELSDKAHNMTAGNGGSDGDGGNGGGGSGDGDAGKSAKDKFAAEAEWKQREEALNRIRGAESYLLCQGGKEFP